MAEVLELQRPAVLRRLVPPVTRQRGAEWLPSLATRDLACLMQVIENELLPRLVSAYAPSTHSPLPRAGRG